MSTTDSRPEPRRKHRWFQYNLRTLLVVTVLASIGMSWLAVMVERARRQGEALTVIKRLGGHVTYDFQYDASGMYLPQAKPPGPVWLRSILGDDLFEKAICVDLSSPQVADANLQVLEQLPHVEVLSLGPNVTDSGLQHVKRLARLRSLSIYYDNEVTDAGLENLKGLTRLRRILCDSANVTDEGVARLQEALPNCIIVR